MVETLEEVDMDDEVEDMTNNEPVRCAEKDLTGEKLIEGLVGNPRFNDSLLVMKLGKMECEAYHSLLMEPIRKVMLKKMIIKKEDMGDIKEDRKKPFILGTPFMTTAKAKIRMELYMMNRQHERMILKSVENGPLIWPSIEENRVTRPKKYSDLSAMEAIHADCDVKETNIILQGLSPEVYALVRNHKVAKELWERIQLLMQETSLAKQERECKLYDEFDKFAYKKGETLREFYLRFSLLLNDMNIYNIKLEQIQVNTKFLNTLPLKWSKFVTDVKLVRDLHTTNVDQLHAYLEQHEFHANEVRSLHERSSDPLALVVIHQMTQGDKLLSLLVLQEHTHQEQVETILGNKGLLSVRIVNGKATCLNSALNQRGNRMIYGLRIKCCWYKLKQMVKFYMRRN
uniref:Integrase, catalytic region, zinc finger, CCHC-type, peptidase aspartic, catalytic n=1 Tax=Tanacetum cinerariifolium TaxID=118510 RepID=A0A699GQG0_TANCI|nr:hypothetical protein [Tanacetum cinerariifolium]